MQTRSSDVVVLSYEAARNERRRLAYELKRAALRYAQSLGCQEPPVAVRIQLKGGRRVKAR